MWHFGIAKCLYITHYFAQQSHELSQYDLHFTIRETEMQNAKKAQ